MDFQKLANLLYENAKPTEYWENKYPKRNLPKGSQVTRFAPSPTGFMHFGNFFMSFVAYQIARYSNGIFFFRLEDTDKKRELVGSGLVAVETLANYGIVPDEGIDLNGKQYGNYGPYVQSERHEIYKTYAKELVKKGRAFPCFCQRTESLDEVVKKREEQLDKFDTLEEKDVCRNLTLEQIEENLKQNKPFALRLLSKGTSEDKIKTYDLIRGERELPANCKDIILIKNNGIPPYAFAHAIDDHFMGTTTVVRGEEWYASYPAHLEIFDALGFEKLNYIHAPIICKIDEATGNKRKLSKRKDKEADMRFFAKAGYPKQALLEYLFTLVNSNFEIWRIKNPNASLSEFPFTIEKIGSSNPMFDLVKLADISKNIIAKLSAQEVYSNLLEWSQNYDEEFYQILKSNKEFAERVFGVDRGGEKPRKDFAKWEDFKQFFSYMFGYFKPTKITDYEIKPETNTNYIKEVLQVYLNTYSQTDEKQVWFDKIKDFSTKLNYTDNKTYKDNPTAYKGTIADVTAYIRLALTGRQNSPDLYTISQILGEDEVKQKLTQMINLL